jgi:hypothetical protein
MDDRMFLESALSPGRSTGGPELMSSPPLVAPELEVVTFGSPAPLPSTTAPEPEVEHVLVSNGEPAPLQPSVVMSDPTALPMSQYTMFVNVLRGSSPNGHQAGVLPTSPSSFSRVLAKQIASMVLPAPPPLQRMRKMDAVQVPHRSSRLTKKATCQTPTVAATQNVLLKKLEFAAEDHLETSMSGSSTRA